MGLIQRGSFRADVLFVFEQKDVFQLKDVEKIAPKEKGISKCLWHFKKNIWRLYILFSGEALLCKFSFSQNCFSFLVIAKTTNGISLLVCGGGLA